MLEWNDEKDSCSKPESTGIEFMRKDAVRKPKKLSRRLNYQSFITYARVIATNLTKTQRNHISYNGMLRELPHEHLLSFQATHFYASQILKLTPSKHESNRLQNEYSKY